MNINEIKKILYRIKPTAFLIKVTKVGIVYTSTIDTEDGKISSLRFIVPLEDIQDAIFLNTMEAQHLIRWLVDDSVKEKTFN